MRQVEQRGVGLAEALHALPRTAVDESDARALPPVTHEVGEVGHMGRLHGKGFAHLRHAYDDEVHEVFRLVAYGAVIQRPVMYLLLPRSLSGEGAGRTGRLAEDEHLARPHLVEVEGAEVDVGLDLGRDVGELENGEGRTVLHQQVAPERGGAAVRAAYMPDQVQAVHVERIVVVFYVVQLPAVAQDVDLAGVGHAEGLQFLQRVAARGEVKVNRAAAKASL